MRAYAYGHAKSTFPLYFVNRDGRLQVTEPAAMNPDTPDPAQFPYGSVLLPEADREGNAVIVFTQPGYRQRTDVLVLDLPEAVRIVSPVERACNRRVRIAMQLLPGSTEQLTTSWAVVRIAAGSSTSQALTQCRRTQLRAVRYTIRVADEAGWFEYGTHAFPDPEFRHGFPDIASRDQGEWGIRGPSLIGIGWQPRIAAHRFAPAGGSPQPGARVIYEIHIGTFTTEGTFSAAVHRLRYLRDMGFTTLQLMPVDISSGPPGWSYDQTRTGAVEGAYGGPVGFIAFLEHAHSLGLEVIVDKQFNHRGPEQDSRDRIIPDMFVRETIWGRGISGAEARHYPQIVRLIGEELADWVSRCGVDGFRLDATNRLPSELHSQIAEFGEQIQQALGKPVYLVSEYAECEPPTGQRVPTGHQYTDQTGRYVMRLLGLSHARHVSELPADEGSLLRAMIKAARRGWWYPDVFCPPEGLRASERVCALLWHHDWIGNRFGGERIHHLISFDLFRTLTVWQALGQWTSLVFMGTEHCARTPWLYFTGHLDADAINHTSAFYCLTSERPVLKAGRFHEFSAEALAAGLREPIHFSEDGGVARIGWKEFRDQRDRFGRPYMDHAKPETFDASKLDWAGQTPTRVQIERLWRKLFVAPNQARITEEEDPRNTQYCMWDGNERAFLMRRRSTDGREVLSFFNLGIQPVSLLITDDSIQARGHGTAYVPSLGDAGSEPLWNLSGLYTLWLDGNDVMYGGAGATAVSHLHIAPDSSVEVTLSAAAALVYCKSPPLLDNTPAPGQ